MVEIVGAFVVVFTAVLVIGTESTIAVGLFDNFFSVVSVAVAGAAGSVFLFVATFAMVVLAVRVAA